MSAFGFKWVKAEGYDPKTTLESMMAKYDTVERGECRDCGNRWWWSMEHCYCCTTCGKSHGRSTGDEYKPKHSEEVRTDGDS